VHLKTNPNTGALRIGVRHRQCRRTFSIFARHQYLSAQLRTRGRRITPTSRLEIKSSSSRVSRRNDAPRRDSAMKPPPFLGCADTGRVFFSSSPSSQPNRPSEKAVRHWPIRVLISAQHKALSSAGHTHAPSVFFDCQTQDRAGRVLNTPISFPHPYTRRPGRKHFRRSLPLWPPSSATATYIYTPHCGGTPASRCSFLSVQPRSGGVAVSA